MWLEFNKLPEFIQVQDQTKIVRSATNQHDTKTGICPEGHGIMTRAKIDTEEPFYLEKCSSCGGIWFDAGEWEKLATNNLIENINDFWCKSWQRKHKKEKDRQNYLENNKQIIGTEVFEKIMELSEILKNHPEKGRALALLQQEIS